MDWIQHGNELELQSRVRLHREFWERGINPNTFKPAAQSIVTMAEGFVEPETGVDEHEKALEALDAAAIIASTIVDRG